MSSATVRIEADVSAITRAFATMRTQYQSALGAMRSDAKRETAARVAMERAAAQQVGQTQRAAIRAQVQMARQAAREEAQLARQAAREKQRAEAEVVRAANRAQREAVRNEERANRERQRSFRQMLRDKVTEERNAVRESERQERNKTRMLMAEWRMQARAYRDAMREQERANREMHSNIARQVREQRRREAGAGRTGSRLTSQTVSTGMSVASGAHGQMVDARRERADAIDALYGQLVTAGVTGPQARQMANQAYTTAGQHGLDPGNLLRGIASAAGQFTMLGSATGYRREGLNQEQIQAAVQTRLNNAIQRGVTARNMGAGPGEMVSLAGMFEERGITGIDDLLGRVAAMQAEGAVSASSVTREAMAPIIARMSAAASAAPPAERMQAMRNAFTRAFAETQIFAASGSGPRLSQNAARDLDASLATTLGASRLRTNILNTRDAADRRTPEGLRLRERMNNLLNDDSENGIFEADPERRGERRLRAAYRGNALALASRFEQEGLSGQTVVGITAGGGQGNRQSAQANWRRLYDMLLSQNVAGESGAQAVRTLMGVNFNQADRTRMAEAAESGPMAEYFRQEAARNDALTQNTGAMGRMSQAIEAWVARNPLAAAAGGEVGSKLLPVATGALGGVVARYGVRAATALRGLFSFGGAAATSEAVATGTTAAATGLGLAGTAAVGGAALGGAAFTSGVLSGRTMAGTELSTGERVGRGVIGAVGLGALVNIFDGIEAAMARGISTGMQNATVTVDPHTVQQVVSSQPAPNGGRSGGPTR